MPPRYRIRLSASERRELTALTRRGTHAARTLTRARALLLADRGLRDGEIATALGVAARTITRLRRRAIEDGVMAALHDRPRPGGTPKLDGPQEAFLVALACSDPPLGRSQWTMQLLAERLVELEVVDTISDETVRRTLKKTISSRGANSSGVFPR
jgi:putative transposase